MVRKPVKGSYGSVSEALGWGIFRLSRPIAVRCRWCHADDMPDGGYHASSLFMLMQDSQPCSVSAKAL